MTALLTHRSSAGHRGVPLHSYAVTCLWYNFLQFGLIWVDSSEVLMVSVLHVLHPVVLHLLWHDDYGDYSKPYGCTYYCRPILHAMESLLRIHDPKKGMEEIAPQWFAPNVFLPKRPKPISNFRPRLIFSSIPVWQPGYDWVLGYVLSVKVFGKIKYDTPSNPVLLSLGKNWSCTT